MARVLVIGGAGYVGSATCAWLKDSGHLVHVLDDLSTGHRELLAGNAFTFGRCGNRELLLSLLKQERFDCVMHFAARSLVAESVRYPQEYYKNNVVQTQTLLDTLISCGIKNFVFSSTCAVFGDPQGKRIHEELPFSPQSPYGETKLAVETLLKKLAEEKGLRSVVLRYFNAAGAEPRLRVGEWHDCESHLIPRALHAISQGQPIEIYGTDYPTPDGSCVRDYVHVWDIAAAHAKAMDRLLTVTHSEGSFEAFNLGSERGYSVREVVKTCGEILNQAPIIVEKARRTGDPSQLVADSTLAKSVLGFQAESDLKSIISSAWNWEKKRAQFKRPALFLDRDGTINEDPGYLRDPAQVKLLPQVGEALAQVKAAGFLLVVVSNQSGVGRGLIDPQAIPHIHKRLDELLGEWGVKIDRYELCFHRPEEDCACRKPKAKLLKDAAHALNIDLSKSYMVGDRESDLAAGFAAQCQGAILVKTGTGTEAAQRMQSSHEKVSFIAANLLEAVQWVLRQ